jgi:hypothetical protein
MKITREMLEAYQDKGRAVIATRSSLYRPTLLPDSYFTSSGELLGGRWHYPKDIGNSRKTLQVVPVLAYTSTVPLNLNPEREWLGLQHQCGGHSNIQLRMIATVLKPTEAIFPKLNQIARDFFYAETGHFDREQLLASTLAAYINALSGLGLDCESSWRQLIESVYPIDPTPENLLKLTGDWTEVAALMAKELTQRVRYSFGDPYIFLLTENSD